MIAEIKSVRKQVNGSYYAGLKISGTHCAAIKVSGADSYIVTEAQAGYFVQDNTISFDNLNTFEEILLKNTNRFIGKKNLFCLDTLINVTHNILFKQTVLKS